MEDQEASKLIALSVGSVMRQSFDDKFKGECKKLLQATNTKMAEDVLYERLMNTIQRGSHGLAREEPAAAITSSSAVEEVPSSSTNATCPINSATAAKETSNAVTTATKANSTSTQQNISLGEMYCRTLQLKKRSLSPQSVKPQPLFRMKKQKQNSAPL